MPTLYLKDQRRSMSRLYGVQDLTVVKMEDSIVFMEKMPAEFFLRDNKLPTVLPGERLIKTKEYFKWLPCKYSDDGIPDSCRSIFEEFIPEWEALVSTQLIPKPDGGMDELRLWAVLSSMARLPDGCLCQNWKIIQWNTVI
jgi:hypothetical protein